MEKLARMTKMGLQGPVLRPLFRLFISQGLLNEAHQLLDEMPQWKSNPLPWNLLLAAHFRFGRPNKAQYLFNEMPIKDLVSWNTMAAGWARSPRPAEALSLFETMLLVPGLRPDGHTLSSILSACARTGALVMGRRVHALVRDMDTGPNPLLVSALIDMYCKCGQMDAGRAVFENCEEAERACSSVWNALISGLAVHGEGREALVVFKRMLDERAAEPDAVTFLGLLTGCSHSGLVQEGLHLLYTMKLIHGLDPGIQHYGAVVDMLARVGRLEEARQAVDVLPVPPDAVVWRALLSACRNQARADLALLPPGPARCSGDYLLVSGLFSRAGRWAHAEAAWTTMTASGVRKKEPGLSWVEVRGRVHRFQAGSGWAHRRPVEEARAMQLVLEVLTGAAREMGFSAETETVPAADLLEEEKEENLMHHSEKVAVAFAVINSAPLTEIRVSKNLRTCVDCHSWLKAASKHLARVIVIRDRTRFHHFADGSCSCRDFW